MILRLAALLVLVVLVALPLAVRPAVPVTWLASGAIVVGGAGVLALAVPLATAGGVLALLAYTAALVAARASAEPATAMIFGVALVLLLALVHLGGRVRGAVVEPAVIARQARDWLTIVALGLAAATTGVAAGAALRWMLVGLGLPMIVIAAALGALLTAAGVSALVIASGAPPAPGGSPRPSRRGP